MGKLSQFFDMTRRERVGLMVVLMVLALSAVLMVVARHRGTDEATMTDIKAMQDYAAQVDSMHRRDSVITTRKTKATKKKGHKTETRKKSKSRPSHKVPAADRPMRNLPDETP